MIIKNDDKTEISWQITGNLDNHFVEAKTPASAIAKLRIAQNHEDNYFDICYKVKSINYKTNRILIS